MPHYSYLRADLHCPNCNILITDLLWFQWGYSPGYAVREEFVYQVGDPIKWKKCQSGEIPAWTYFGEGGGNLGDPSIKNLIVRDSAQYFLQQPCSNCQYRLGGAALEIVDGKIVKAWLLVPNELDENVDAFVRERNGALKPMHSWNDHPMSTTETC